LTRFSLILDGAVWTIVSLIAVTGDTIDESNSGYRFTEKG